MHFILHLNDIGKTCKKQGKGIKNMMDAFLNQENHHTSIIGMNKYCKY